MKKLILSIAFLIGLSVTVFAQDFNSKYYKGSSKDQLYCLVFNPCKTTQDNVTMGAKLDGMKKKGFKIVDIYTLPKTDKQFPDQTVFVYIKSKK